MIESKLVHFLKLSHHYSLLADRLRPLPLSSLLLAFSDDFLRRARAGLGSSQ